jgi:hypothetical protein
LSYVKVKDNENLVRDSYSKAILNTDSSALERHKRKVEAAKKEKLQQDRINNLEQELAHIKELLQKLIP